MKGSPRRGKLSCCGMRLRAKRRAERFLCREFGLDLAAILGGFRDF